MSEPIPECPWIQGAQTLVDLPAQPDPDNCALTGYYSAAVTSTKVCPTGSRTATITVTLPYGSAFSPDSQEDADLLAQQMADNTTTALRALSPCAPVPTVPLPGSTADPFWNTEQSVTLSCDGGTPEATVVVLAHSFSASSQVDADALAVADATAQCWALLNCVWTSTEQIANSSCPTGSTGLATTYTMVAGSFFSHVSQADADAQALAAAQAVSDGLLECTIT